MSPWLRWGASLRRACRNVVPYPIISSPIVDSKLGGFLPWVGDQSVDFTRIARGNPHSGGDVTLASISQVIARILLSIGIRNVEHHTFVDDEVVTASGGVARVSGPVAPDGFEMHGVNSA